MLAGFETPDAGRLFIDGQDMTGVPPYRRPVNMMFQSYALFPHMDVAANVGYGLRREGVPAGRRSPQRVAEVAGSWCISATTRSAGRRSSPAASASGWRSPARW